MSQIDAAWGAGPSADYEALAERFRPLFARIRETAIEREVNRQLPFEQFAWLKEAGFFALRVPQEYGGSGIDLAHLFALLIELGEADSNLVQILRGHMAFVEIVLNSHIPAFRKRWLPRLGAGETVGQATSEVGDAKRAEFTATVVRKDDHLILNGTKFYTTGALYSDWIDVGATAEDGTRSSVYINRHAQGVEIIDDWAGFGQTLTASGTAHFRDVRAELIDVIAVEDRFRYSPGYFQLFHLANLAGLGRAMTSEVAQAVAQRTRTFSIGNAPRVSFDPQILQIVGKVRSAAYCAGAIVLKNAEALQRVADLRFRHDPVREDKASQVAELEVGQALTVVSDLILNASTLLFDALGASATLRPQGLDRFWRNARTLTSHNPRVYKERIVGDFAVNGNPPPAQWRVGVAD